jgi:hypothetical protein
MGSCILEMEILGHVQRRGQTKPQENPSHWKVAKSSNGEKGEIFLGTNQFL